MGGRRALLLSPYLVLVHQSELCLCGPQGLHRQSHRRCGISARHVHDRCRPRRARNLDPRFRERCATTSALLGPATATIAAILLFVGATGKSAQIPALRMAARCDGGPHSGQRADPCRDDGDRRRVHGRADALPLHARAHRDGAGRDHRRSHRDLRRVNRAGSARHQKGSRLLDHQPARLHVPRRRRRRIFLRHLSRDDARLLQGAAVPLRRFCHSCARRRAGHVQDGRAAQEAADHLRDDADRDAGDLRDAAVFGLLLQGSDP